MAIAHTMVTAGCGQGAFSPWQQLASAPLASWVSDVCARAAPPQAFRQLTDDVVSLVRRASTLEWSQVIFIAVLVVASALFCTWGLWRLRVSRYNEFWGLKKSVHFWGSFTTSAQPQYCSSCRQLICGFWIFRNTGWECTVCGRTAHMRCLAACDKFDCKCPSQSEPLRHQLVQGNLPGDSVCCICGIICSSPFGLHGLRCLWCGRTVDEGCSQYLPEYCDLGHFQKLVLPPSLVRLSVASTASPFANLSAFLQSYAPSALARSSSKLSEVRSQEGQTDVLAEFSASAQRYMKSMSLQLKEGLSQVQIAMAAGLFEGLKEVTADVRHLNVVLRREFRRRIRRELQEQQIEQDRIRMEQQQQQQRQQQATGAIVTTSLDGHFFNRGGLIRRQRGRLLDGSSSCPERTDPTEKKSIDVNSESIKSHRAQTDTETTTSRKAYYSASTATATPYPLGTRHNSTALQRCRSERRRRRHTESLVSIALAFSESSVSSSINDETAPSSSQYTQRGSRNKHEQQQRPMSAAIMAAGSSPSALGYRRSQGDQPVPRAILHPYDAATRTRKRELSIIAKQHPRRSQRRRRHPSRTDHERQGYSSSRRQTALRPMDLSKSMWKNSALDSDPRLHKTQESLSIRETRLRYRRHRIRRLEQKRLQAMAAALAARQDRYSDRLFELARLMPARADVWEIVLDTVQTDPPTIRRGFSNVAYDKSIRKGTHDLEPSLRVNRFYPLDKSAASTPQAATTSVYQQCQQGATVAESHQDTATPMAIPPILQNRRPLLVFVNAKSGGQVGAQLLKELYKLLNPMQVCDVQSDGGPQRALTLFRGLAMINRLRVLVCGGDGTAGWVIKEIQRIYGPPSRCHVPVGLLPLGTGNDLSRILGWGASFDGDVGRHLMKVETAQSRLLDLWHIRVTRQRNAESSKSEEILDATFNNYMDIGVAARIALRFHQLREAHPELFQSRVSLHKKQKKRSLLQLGNKFLYGEMGVRDWVSERAIDLSQIRIYCDGVPVMLPEARIEGLIVVNIPSFSGGVSLWPDDDQDDTEQIFRNIGVPEPPMPTSLSAPLLKGESSVFPSPSQPSKRGSTANSSVTSMAPWRNPLSSDTATLTAPSASINIRSSRPCGDDGQATTKLGASDAVVSSVHDRRIQNGKKLWRQNRVSMKKPQWMSVQRSARELHGPARRRSPSCFSTSSSSTLSSASSDSDDQINVAAPSSRLSRSQHCQQAPRLYTAFDQRPATTPPRPISSPPQRFKHSGSKLSKTAIGTNGKRRRPKQSQSFRCPSDLELSSTRRPAGADSSAADSTAVQSSPTWGRQQVTFDAGSHSKTAGTTTPNYFSHEAHPRPVHHRWRKQSMRDELIEVVAVRSLFHLGQVQVGLAEPLRVCQGRTIRIEIPVEVPFQIDGEPRLIPPSVIDISHKGESFVLSPVKSHDEAVMNKVTEILDSAVKENIISNLQRSILLRELNKRV